MDHIDFVITEETGVNHAGHHYAKGQHPLPRNLAEYFASVGWGHSVDATLQATERKPGVVVLQPETVKNITG